MDHRASSVKGYTIPQALRDFEQSVLRGSIWIAGSAFGTALLLGLAGKEFTSGFWKDALEVTRTTLEAIGASFLTYTLVERRIKNIREVGERSRLQEVAASVLGAIYRKPFSPEVISAITRDVVDRILEVNRAECTIDVGYNGDNHIVSLDIREFITTIENFKGRKQSVEALSGDAEPWKLEFFSLSKDDINDSSMVLFDRNGNRRACKLISDFQTGKEIELEYIFNAQSGEKLIRRRLWKKIFPFGIMSNHVFLDGANKLSVSISVSRRMTKDIEYPIQVWFGIYGESGLPIPEPAYSSDKISYKYETDHIFLPSQGFSFFLRQRPADNAQS